MNETQVKKEMYAYREQCYFWRRSYEILMARLPLILLFAFALGCGVGWGTFNWLFDQP